MHCLGKGVDVPNMDGIAFINPKSSEIRHCTIYRKSY